MKKTKPRRKDIVRHPVPVLYPGTMSAKQYQRVQRNIRALNLLQINRIKK